MPASAPAFPLVRYAGSEAGMASWKLALRRAEFCNWLETACPKWFL